MDPNKPLRKKSKHITDYCARTQSGKPDSEKKNADKVEEILHMEHNPSFKNKGKGPVPDKDGNRSKHKSKGKNEDFLSNSNMFQVPVQPSKHYVSKSRTERLTEEQKREIAGSTSNSEDSGESSSKPPVQIKYKNPITRLLDEHTKKLEEKARVKHMKMTDPKAYEQHKRQKAQENKRKQKINAKFDNLAYGEHLNDKDKDSLSLEDLYEDDEEAESEVVPPEMQNPEDLVRFEQDLSVLLHTRVSANSFGSFTTEDANPEAKVIEKYCNYFPKKIDLEELIEADQNTLDPFKIITEKWPDFEQKPYSDNDPTAIPLRNFLQFCQPRTFVSQEYRDSYVETEWYRLINEQSGTEIFREYKFNNEEYIIVYTRISYNVFGLIILQLRDKPNKRGEPVYSLLSFWFIPGETLKK